jgi:hypothetical protein
MSACNRAKACRKTAKSFRANATFGTNLQSNPWGGEKEGEDGDSRHRTMSARTSGKLGVAGNCIGNTVSEDRRVFVDDLLE